MGTAICKGHSEPDGSLLEAGGPCGGDRECDGWLEREAILKSEWQFVGEGKGDFDQVRGYNFVGEGRGSYKGGTSTTYHGWRLGSFSSGALALVASVVGGLLLWRVLTSASDTPGKGLRARPSRVVAVVSENQSAASEKTVNDSFAGRGLPVFNCSSHYFQQPWTPAKAAWCCAHEAAGCRSTTPASRPPLTTWMLLPVPVLPDSDEPDPAATELPPTLAGTAATSEEPLRTSEGSTAKPAKLAELPTTSAEPRAVETESLAKPAPLRMDVAEG